MEQEPLTILLDARLESGWSGGIEQVILGMAHGLASLDGEESYVFLAYEGQSEWLEPFIRGSASIELIPPPQRGAGGVGLTKSARIIRGIKRRLLDRQKSQVSDVPVSNGTAERLRADVVHFLKQDAFLTAIPSIYHPHDLQHLHLPEFFSKSQQRQRTLWYRAFCDQARVVSVTSEWGKRDLVESFSVPERKVAVIPLAPAISVYDSGGTVGADDAKILIDLPEAFALYPAQTWPHKNHLRLIEAVDTLARRDIDIRIVCTGRRNEHFAEIQEAIRVHSLGDRVFFTGFVTPGELQVLFHKARCLVMPTLFEAAGGFGPIAEAFHAGLPVVCSNVNGIPEEVGEAALLFDPTVPSAIASALQRVWSDEDLREDLVKKGRNRVSRYTWRCTALRFRALYRKLGNRPLAGEDIDILREIGGSR